MMSGDEFYDDDVTSGPIVQLRRRCRVCGKGLHPMQDDNECDSCAFDRWSEDREGYVVEPLDWKGELGAG